MMKLLAAAEFLDFLALVVIEKQPRLGCWFRPPASVDLTILGRTKFGQFFFLKIAQNWNFSEKRPVLQDIKKILKKKKVNLQLQELSTSIGEFGALMCLQLPELERVQLRAELRVEQPELMPRWVDLDLSATDQYLVVPKHSQLVERWLALWPQKMWLSRLLDLNYSFGQLSARLSLYLVGHSARVLPERRVGLAEKVDWSRVQFRQGQLKMAGLGGWVVARWWVSC